MTEPVIVAPPEVTPGSGPPRRERHPPSAAALVGLLCVAVAGAADAVMRHEAGATGDEPFYMRMAAHPGGPHSFPYAYRIAVPWLVHVLPFSQVVSFQVLALLAIGAGGAAMYVLLREFDIGRRLAIALAVGLAVSPNLLVVVLRHGRSIDPAATLVMVLGTLFIVRRDRLALAVTILIGAAVKETSLFLIPFTYAVWARRPVDRAALRDTGLVALAPVAGYIALRVSITAVGSQYIPGYGGSFLSARLDVLRQVFTGVELRRLAYAFGPLWLVAPFALRRLSFARRGLVLVALCVAAMTVSFDAGRIIFVAAPVFYVASACVVGRRHRLAVITVLALFALDVGYAIYMQAYGVQHGIDATPTSAIRVY
jgi:hypothetical protein